jgi:hypothetical protein
MEDKQVKKAKHHHPSSMPKDHAAMLTGLSPAANSLGGLFKMPQAPQLHLGKANPQHQGFNEIQSRMITGGQPQQIGAAPS